MRKMTSRGEEVYSIDVFEILFDYELTRAKRNPAPLVMLHIEVTPTTSNEETRKAASTVFITALNSHLRSVDIPSTAGRDFRVLLPTTDEAGARTVCERLLSVFKNKFDSPSGSVAFSLQIGAAVCPAGVTLTMDEISEKTKEALKQSKLKGPNTFVITTS
jgi:GGDEF domain-containing protein